VSGSDSLHWTTFTRVRVNIADLDLHIPALSVSICDFAIRQEANPDPAVAVFARIDF
jgi:hypothetical protein